MQRFISGEIARLTASGSKNEPSGAMNSQSHSCRNIHEPSDRRSCSRNAGEIREQSDARAIVRCHPSPCDHSDQYHPRIPHAVERQINLPSETASIGRTAAYSSSSTRAPSSMMRRATFAKPRTVPSEPGRLTILLPPRSSNRNALSASIGAKSAKGG